jgi:hypothetical protein
MGTHRELEKNMLGTMKKTLCSHLKLKRKKNNALTIIECMLSLPIGCMKFLFPKLFVTILGLG